MQKEKKIPSNWKRKLITGLCFCILLTTIPQNIYAKDDTITIVEERLEDIINRYELNHQKAYILANEDNFRAYYQALVENNNLSEKDRKMALQSFYHVNKYLAYDFENQLQKLRHRSITVDDGACQNQTATGLFYHGTDDIRVITNVDDLTLIHENIHHHWDFPNQLYLNNGKMVKEQEKYTDILSGDGLVEALASDLSAQEYSKDGFTVIYKDLNLCLQGLYAIFGREKMLTMLSHPDYLKRIYLELQSTGLESSEIIMFFQHLEELHAIETNQKVIKKDRNQVCLELSSDLINLYEAKKGKNWQDSKALSIIICALNHPQPNKFFLETTNSKVQKNVEEMNCFLQDRNLDGIDFQNSMIQVVVESENPNWSGDLCVLREEVALELGSVNAIKYTWNHDTLAQVKSYNSFEEQIREKLIAYQIPETEWHTYLEFSNFFCNYELEINDTNYLTKSQKSYLIGLFPQFCKLHSILLQNNQVAAVQSLFMNAMNNCESWEEVLTLYNKEDALYQKGGQSYLNYLSSEGFIDYETQKTIFPYLEIYSQYQSLLMECLHNKTITEDEFSKLKLEFLVLLNNYPELTNHSSEDTTIYLEEIFENVQSASEIYHRISRQEKTGPRLIRIPN